MTEMMPYLFSALGGLMMILIALVSWVGANTIAKIDKLDQKMTEQHGRTTERLVRLETELQQIERRVVALEDDRH